MMKEEGESEASEDPQAEAELAYDIVYTQPEILRSCVAKLSVGTIFLAMLVIACGVVPQMLDADYHFSVAGVLLQIVLSGSCIAAVIKRWFGDYGFRAARVEDKIVVSSGLFKKKNYEVPVDKINALSFRTTMIGRLCGRYHVMAINIGGEDEDVDGMEILLAEKPEDLRKRLTILLPELSVDDFLEVHRQPLRVLCKKLVLWCVAMVLAFAVIEHFVSLGIFIVHKPLFYGVFAALLVFVVVVTIAAFQIRSTIMKDEYMLVSKGLLGRKVDRIAYDKIQYLSFRQGPIQRAMHVKHAKIHILASAASQEHVSAAYEEEVFDRLKEKFEKTY